MTWYECYAGHGKLRFVVSNPILALRHNEVRPEWPRITKIIRPSDGRTWLIDGDQAKEIVQLGLGI